MNKFQTDGSKGEVKISLGLQVKVFDWLNAKKELLLVGGFATFSILGLGQVALSYNQPDYDVLTSISAYKPSDNTIAEIVNQDIVKIVSFKQGADGKVSDIRTSLGTVINDSGTHESKGLNSILTTASNIRTEQDYKTVIYVNNTPLDADVRIITRNDNYEDKTDMAVVSVIPKNDKSNQLYASINGATLADVIPRNVNIKHSLRGIEAGTPIIYNDKVIGMIGNNNTVVDLKSKSNSQSVIMDSHGLSSFIDPNHIRGIRDIHDNLIYGLGHPGQTAGFTYNFNHDAMIPMGARVEQVKVSTLLSIKGMMNII